MTFTFVVLALTILLLVSGRLRLDLVALMALLALFLGEGIYRSGFAAWLGQRLVRRLSDIVFVMMRDKTPYDPGIHRRKQQLHKRNCTRSLDRERRFAHLIKLWYTGASQKTCERPTAVLE